MDSKMIGTKAIAAAGLTLATAGVSHAASVNLTYSGSGSGWLITFDDLTFTDNGASGQMDWLIFEDFFNGDATGDGNTNSGTGTFSINSGTPYDFSTNNNNGVLDNVGLPSIDPNDLFINFTNSSPATSSGDTLTITDGGADGEGVVVGMNPSIVPSFTPGKSITASIWSSGSGGALQSDILNVTIAPEPGSLALMAMGGLCLLRRRRRASFTPLVIR